MTTDIEQPASDNQSSNCSIFDGVELCDWPIHRSRDVWELRGRVFDHIQKQMWYLSGEGEEMKWVRNGTKWYRKIGGVYYCQLRVLGTALVLNHAGHTTFKANSVRKQYGYTKVAPTRC
jgi:hypothetical protein